MRVVVTGAGGFLGSAFCAAAVERGWHVRGLGHLRAVHELRAAIPSSVELFDRDLTGDRDGLRTLFRGADVVVHLAGVAGEVPCLAEPVRAALANVVGTSEVVEAARAAGVPRLLFTSSYWVYSVYSARTMPLREDDPLGTDTLYGALKVAGEAMVRSFAGGISVRLSNVYGYGTGVGAQWDGFVGRTIRSAVAHEAISLFGDGTQGIELLHVRDAIHALLLLAERPSLRHNTYNLGSGRVTTVRTVAAIVAELARNRLGRPSEVTFQPAPAGKIWPDRWLDVSRISSEIGFRARVSPEVGLGELWERVAA